MEETGRRERTAQTSDRVEAVFEAISIVADNEAANLWADILQRISSIRDHPRIDSLEEISSMLSTLIKQLRNEARVGYGEKARPFVEAFLKEEKGERAEKGRRIVDAVRYLDELNTLVEESLRKHIRQRDSIATGQRKRPRGGEESGGRHVAYSYLSRGHEALLDMLYKGVPVSEIQMPKDTIRQQLSTYPKPTIQNILRHRNVRDEHGHKSFINSESKKQLIDRLIDSGKGGEAEGGEAEGGEAEGEAEGGEAEGEWAEGGEAEGEWAEGGEAEGGEAEGGEAEGEWAEGEAEGGHEDYNDDFQTRPFVGPSAVSSLLNSATPVGRIAAGLNMTTERLKELIVRDIEAGLLSEAHISKMLSNRGIAAGGDVRFLIDSLFSG
jgi:hypothetical protein